MWAMRLNIVDWGLFQDSDFAGDLKTQNQHQAEFSAFLDVEHVYQSVGCAKKQTSVSHSSTESEIMSVDAGLRMDGSLALDFWDLFIEVLRTTHGIPKPTQASTRETGAALQSTPKITQVSDQNVDLSNVDQVLWNAHLSEKGSQLYIFEDNEAVIKMIIKGRSPTMRHVSRTHRVALDWLFDGIILDAKIQIKYVDSKKNQLEDILTKVSFTRDERHNLLHLFNIMNDTIFSCSHFSDSHPFLPQESSLKCGKDLREALRLFHQQRKQKHVVSSRDTACLWEKNLRVTMKA